MPKKTRIKRTYSFRKLQKKFPFIVADAVNVIGRRLVKSIMDGVDRGVDVNGKPFEPLSANTKALGGNKPLKRSGKMKDGLTKKPATVQDLKFVIDATATSRGEIYGAFIIKVIRILIRKSNGLKALQSQNVNGLEFL